MSPIPCQANKIDYENSTTRIKPGGRHVLFAPGEGTRFALGVSFLLFRMPSPAVRLEYFRGLTIIHLPVRSVILYPVPLEEDVITVIRPRPGINDICYMLIRLNSRSPVPSYTSSAQGIPQPSDNIQPFAHVIRVDCYEFSNLFSAAAIRNPYFIRGPQKLMVDGSPPEHRKSRVCDGLRVATIGAYMNLETLSGRNSSLTRRTGLPNHKRVLTDIRKIVPIEIYIWHAHFLLIEVRLFNWSTSRAADLINCPPEPFSVQIYANAFADSSPMKFYGEVVFGTHNSTFFRSARVRYLQPVAIPI